MNHGDIHWADLPDANGREQRGRRPALIWHDIRRFMTPTILVIPFTTRVSALKFSGARLIDPSAGNGLTAPSVLMVFQLRACDILRIGARIGRLDDPDLTAIQQLAKDLQMLP